MFTFLLWCILFILCWPLAIVALIVYPLVWLFLRLAAEGELRQQLIEQGFDPVQVARAVRSAC